MPAISPCERESANRQAAVLDTELAQFPQDHLLRPEELRRWSPVRNERAELGDQLWSGVDV